MHYSSSVRIITLAHKFTRAVGECIFERGYEYAAGAAEVIAWNSVQWKITQKGL